MIEIDGSEAGGQLVRTSVALSVLTGKAVKITNIRGARPEPGLKTQHMEGIKSLGELCDAEIKGLSLGSRELEFYPERLKAKDLEIKISTAGSIGLILQALLIATAKLEKSIRIKIIGGGTWNKWAPPVIYLERVFFPLINEKTKIKIIRDGFYPKGGAEVEVNTQSLNLKPLDISERSKISNINIFSVSSSNLKDVADRQAKEAERLIREKFNITPEVEVVYVDAYSAGSGILAYITTGNSIIGSDSLGEKGKKSEDVAREAVKNLVSEYANGLVDRHAADMLLPYMALANEGRILTSEITHHIKTNIRVIESFLPVKFIIEGNIISVNKI